MKIQLSLIIIDGPMGSGKTTVATMLHEQLFDTALLGVDRMKQFVRAAPGSIKQLYDASQDVVMAMAESYLNRGVSVIIEQVMRKDEAETYELLANKCQAVFFLLETEGI